MFGNWFNSRGSSLSHYSIRVFCCMQRDKCSCCKVFWNFENKARSNSLTKEVITFCPLPRLNAESDGFLSFDESQGKLDKGDTVVNEMKDYHKMRKKNEGDSTQLDIARKNDGKLTKLTNWSKVRRVLKCQCNARRCVFSRCAPGQPKGPKKKHFNALDKYIEEHGYRCGDCVRIYKNGMCMPDSGGE